MTSYVWPLQQAVYAALVAAALPHVVKIVDHRIERPKANDFPYVQIGEDGQSLQDDVSCADGSQEILNLHTWSRSRGQKQIKEIMGAIHGALHNTALTVSGLVSCHVFVESGRILDDPDGKTRHGVTTLRIYCREA
ncbi:hypothetical protein FIV00_15075 [Labrenzia sp. THAF82]|uniref:DUF3168 domain-containing protein n=1 Tax=Labrenzia sp. THAF82 TaxID=2587861 RepID=UPI0012A84557|nr:DUF3168 domain-containing protein [Labrenzia sp. THAF82]QFT31813.1 hypothetical protein FIV00_15075 [Labrenzia sp. THAF82]